MSYENVDGQDPLAYMGPDPVRRPGVLSVNRAPTTADTARLGTLWIDTAAQAAYCLTGFSSGLPVWEVLGSSTAAVSDLDADTGTATPVGGSITIAGDTGISTSATGDTVTIAPADDLAAVEGLSGSGVVTRTGSNTWATNSIADRSIVVGDTGNTVQGIGPLADGELVIGATGSDPAAATLTAGTAIDITNAANSVTVDLADKVRLQPGYVENIGIDYNGGTGVFTVQGSQAALSASNPGYITLQSRADPGELTLYEITANQDFIDDVGSSEIIGNLFGLTTGIAHSAQIPFYLYAVGNDNEDAIAFMISRVPHAKQSPAAAAIGDPGDPVSDTQGSFWSLETITETEYDANPCLCIGSFVMTMSASDDWTVVTLSALDGIGEFQEGRVFGISTGQYGAASGTYLKANGGTAPVFSSGAVYYTISKDGRVMVDYTINTDGGTDGSGAVTALAVLPYPMVTQNITAYQGSGFVQTSSATYDVNCQIQTLPEMAFAYNSTLTASAFIQNGDFGNGARSINVQVIYAALPSE